MQTKKINYNIAKTRETAKFLVDREIAFGRGTFLADRANKKYPPNIIDKVSQVSPFWESQRQRAKMEHLIMSGGYDVVQSKRTKRLFGKIQAAGSADNAADDQTLWQLREMCRDHDRNSSLLHGIIQRATDNIFGPEFNFIPDSTEKSFNEEASAALAEKSQKENAEYRGLFSLQQIIKLTIRAMFPDGDMLFNFLSDGSIQPIESHQLVTPYNKTGYNGRRVVGGVELDDRGRHTAYYIADPNDTISNGWIGNFNKAQRLDASNAILIANRNRFSQTRGVPALAPCLDMFESLDDYLDSEMLAAKLDADRVWWVKRPEATTSLPGVNTNEDLNSDETSETTFSKLLRHEPGMIYDLLQGEEVGSTGGERPHDQFEAYIVTVMRMIGAALGFPLELVLLDFSKTNYSSARASLLQAYRTFKCWQVFSKFFIIQPVYNKWMSKWIASGDLSPVKGAFKLSFIPSRWAWVDPLKEILASIEKIKAGAGTITDIVNEEGRTMEEVAKIRQREIAILKEYGVPSSVGTNPKSNNKKNNQDQSQALAQQIISAESAKEQN